MIAFAVAIDGPLGAHPVEYSSIIAITRLMLDFQASSRNSLSLISFFPF